MQIQLDDMLAQLKLWRQDLHQYPETAFEETRTSKLVQQRLESFGIKTYTGFAKTGVVGVLSNGSSTKKIGFRADMDALPIAEENQFAYKSKNQGKMHACGHDGHTSILLGVAQYLAKHKNFDGTIYFYFQPAEENGGGANVMIQEGLFEQFGPDEVYALHNMPGKPIGSIAVRSGAILAAPDVFEIHIKGLGGHAALPHKTVDPVFVAAQMLSALQVIAARKTNPLDSIVLSTTCIQAGDIFNVIPESATLKGTVRTLSAATRDFAQEQMTVICDHIAKAFGASAQVDYKRMYPVTINDEVASEYARQAAIAAVGDDNVLFPDVIMGGEDFSYMLEQVSGCMVYIGNGDSYGWHHPRFDFCDEAIEYGVKWFIHLAQQRLTSLSS